MSSCLLSQRTLKIRNLSVFRAWNTYRKTGRVVITATIMFLSTMHETAEKSHCLLPEKNKEIIPQKLISKSFFFTEKYIYVDTHVPL